VITKPMLAAKVKSIQDVKYPVIVSPKLDGIRCLIIDGKALSRSFKPIQNQYIREYLEQHTVDGMDGEIISGVNFQECSSNVMSRSGQPNFVYHVFDYVQDRRDVPYEVRIAALEDLLLSLDNSKFKSVPTYAVHSEVDLRNYENEFLQAGYEGIILRKPDGPYKCGRSTLREGWLLKMKAEEDSEAVIEDFEEMYHNENEAEKNELGYSKRSHSLIGKVPAGVLGKLIVRDVYTGVKFGIGTGIGLTAALREEIWENRESYKGKIVKYRFQSVGVKEAPRCPSFQGFRHVDDLS